jgi:hypothetical protein
VAMRKDPARSMTTHVPCSKRPPKRAPCGEHARSHANTLSGVWVCELETITPLCIKSYFQKPGPSGEIYIPGSSLRGMLRSVVEMLGASCTLRNCSLHSACIACRVFGFVQGDTGWQGKIEIGDTVKRTCKMIGMPAPPMGGKPPLAPAGACWRLFRHSVPTVFGGPLRCAGIGEVFKFGLRYEDLSREEYDVLKFALTLQGGGLAAKVCHKLGYAKSQGLGSCVVRISGDLSSAVGAGIGPYVADPAFAVFVAERSY